VSKKSTAFVRDLEAVYKGVPSTSPRVAAALRAILNATLVATRTLEDDAAGATRELEALAKEADASLKRLNRARRAHPTAAEASAARKKAEERIQFLKVLRHSLSSWRLPPPSAARKAPPTLRDVAAQLAKAIEHEQALAIAEESGVILPTMGDMVDAIMREWARHTEASGDYHLGDSGSQQMVVDAFRGVGFPKRVADALYDFEAHHKKRAHA
jgi:hypothetical protein